MKCILLVHIEKFGALLSPFPTELVHICVFYHCIHYESSVKIYSLTACTMLFTNGVVDIKWISGSTCIWSIHFVLK